MASDPSQSGFNRRNALKAAAMGGLIAASSASPAPASPAPAAPKRGHASYDVIILGGGFAGTTAARELGQAGYRCLILEARNRLGGRTFSTEVFGRKSEVGGQWVHWLQPHVWAEIARYGMTLYETPGAVSPKSVGVLAQGKLTQIDPATCFAMLDAGMQQVCKGSAQLFPRPFDPWFKADFAALDKFSVADRLAEVQLAPLDRTMMEAYLTTNLNGPLKDGGLLDQIHWYARAGGNTERLLQACAQFKMNEGTIGLITKILGDSRAEVKLNTPVSRVEQSARGVRVTAEDGQVFSARVCVAALPMNCWADIDWRPALLPGKMAASRQRHAGSGFELHVLLEGDAGSYQAMSAAPNPINLYYTDAQTAKDTVMVALGAANDAFDMNDDAQVTAAVEQLHPGVKVLQSYAYDWNADPYAKGTWCNYKPGMWTRYGRDMQKPEGRIIFAGSDTANGWRGFIDGAIETGLRAGREGKALLAKG
jgi:monoamine oxidase